MNRQKNRPLGFVLMVCLIRSGVVGAEPRAILEVLPSEESLGKHWKREVQLLFDPLSDPPEMASTASPLPESFRNEQFDRVKDPRSDVSGWSHVQYTLHMTNGPASYDVQIERYRVRQRLVDEFNKLSRIDSEQYQQSPVTGLGEAALFYRNTEGDGSTVCFRSSDFKVWISPSRRVTSWEQDVNLQRVAVQLDRRINPLAEATDDPIHDGRPLSAWVDQLLQTSRHAPSHRSAVKAVRAIGTNAIPWLLRELTAAPWTASDISAQLHRNRARWGFWALGEIGSPAIPDLIKLMDQQPEGVPSALAGIGTPALPALKLCLAHATTDLPLDTPESRRVASALSGLYVAMDRERIPKDQAAFLLPTVDLLRQSTNRTIAYWARGVYERLAPAIGSDE